MNLDQQSKELVQVLAFVHHYTKLHGRPPAEADMVQYFKVSPPSVHTMVKTLERRGFIAREPGRARSTRLLVPPSVLPELESAGRASGPGIPVSSRRRAGALARHVDQR